MTYIKGEKIIHFKKQVKVGDYIFMNDFLFKVLKIGNNCHILNSVQDKCPVKYINLYHEYKYVLFFAIEQKSIKQQIIDKCKECLKKYHSSDECEPIAYIDSIKRLVEQLGD